MFNKYKQKGEREKIVYNRTQHTTEISSTQREANFKDYTYLSSCVFPRETSISGSAEGSRGIEWGPREEVVSPTANRALDFTSRGVG